ncbi:MAG TPA: DNA polymerase III subunit gamma/tau [Pyrinomonadaceae bacterium]|nr:DNA polymerase III subunit gamma/tau [Pyrinomonadaceae bacterium]
MSYQVIARKWRPQTFEEVTGQEAITQTLKNALEYDRLHHAYLFSGARGVGKTTTARLLAKALNCHKTGDKPNVVPCRTDASDACPSCIEISESRSMDVLEIDAASHTGVDDIRDTILEGINIRAARDRFKVFIIDEVHMLSRNSFNALLKTLEEPPPNVMFIMATTELHKVPETILSRCQEFEFRTIALQKIFDRLKIIAGAEKIEVSDAALKEIARSGEGSMRDAQSNFDQVISFSGEKIDLPDVASALGLAGSAIMVKVLSALGGQDSRSVLEVVDELTSRGHDLRSFCRDMLSLFRDLLVFKVSDGDEKLAESSALTPAELAEYASGFNESDLVRFFNSLSETESKLREAVNGRYVLEIGLVKLIEMRSLTGVESILRRLAAIEGGLTDSPGIGESTPEPPIAEKKTLNGERAHEKHQFPAAFPAQDESRELAEAEPIAVEPVGPTAVLSGSSPLQSQSNERSDSAPISSVEYDLTFLDSIEFALPDIPSEMLDHSEDEWLDNAYSRRLASSGDDLRPIAGAKEMAVVLTGTRKPAIAVGIDTRTASGAAAAAAPAFNVNARPVFEVDPSVERPPLSESATQEEMIAYAESDPTVRAVLRIFQGSIKHVRRT